MDLETFEKLQELSAKGNWVEIVAMMTEELCCVTSEEDEFGARLWRLRALLQMSDDQSGVDDANWLLEHLQVANKVLEHFDSKDEAHLKEELYRLKGRDAYRNKKYEDAISYYNKVLELDPHFAIIYRERGAAYYAMGDRDRAQEDLQTYFREDPEAAEEVSGKFDAKGTE